MNKSIEIMTRAIQDLVINPASKFASETNNRFVHTRTGEVLSSLNIKVLTNFTSNNAYKRN